MHCSLFHSQHDEPNRSSHTITHVVHSHSHRVSTSLNNSRTQNDRHVLTRDEFHTSNKEKNKAKMKFTNTMTNTTLLTTKTFTYKTLSTLTTTTFTFTFTTTTFTTTTFITITTFTWSSKFLSFSRLVCTHSLFTCSCNARITLANGPAILQISNAFIPKSFST